MVSEKDGMTMVYIPEGKFNMGSNKGLSDEKPIHVVYLDNFWIDLTEVTNAMFTRFLNEMGNHKEGGANWLDSGDKDARISQVGGVWQADSGYADHPAVEVTWYGADSYCQWAGRALPSEAQWEKAARGTDGQTYPWGEGINCGLANYWGCDEFPRTSPVGHYPDGASPYGALDMAGNVWEWVLDSYDANYYRDSPYENPANHKQSGALRVIRGGSWGHGERAISVFAVPSRLIPEMLVSDLLAGGMGGVYPPHRN
jgi:formylglycine-generating enzyme required for sulfatase activity